MAVRNRKQPPTPTEALADEVYEFGLCESPVGATYVGDRRYEDQLEERGPEARARRLSATNAFLARARRLPARGLSEEDAFTRAVLLRSLAESVEAHEHSTWEWDLDQLGGFHVRLQDLPTYHPLHDERGAEAFVARLEQVPTAFLQWKGDLREGLASGRVAPRVAYERCLAQVEAFLAVPPEETPLGRVARRLPRTLPAAVRRRVGAAVLAAVRSLVLPAYRDFASFLRTEYAGRAREAPGVDAIPGGREAYAFLVRRSTTTDLTPAQIHAIGTAELEKNRAEMLSIARRQGHGGDLRSYLEGLRGDPRFRLATRSALLARYRRIVRKAQAALPRAFGRLPRTACRVDPMPAHKEQDAPAAYYQSPSNDGTRPGVFLANLRDPPSWPAYQMETLAIHEAVPGHHLQITLALEQKDLPHLRRRSHFTAYVEGWAHYAERLADEMGLYSAEEDRVGMLADQAWRAARLVVDTGIHALSWTRERALALLCEVKTGPESDAANEVDRYIVWPGQALAYKVGHLRIHALRENVRAALGERFDLRAFHDEVLRHGALPLSVLEDVIGRWLGRVSVSARGGRPRAGA